jgi:hypothetical protein
MVLKSIIPCFILVFQLSISVAWAYTVKEPFYNRDIIEKQNANTGLGNNGAYYLTDRHTRAVNQKHQRSLEKFYLHEDDSTGLYEPPIVVLENYELEKTSSLQGFQFTEITALVRNR